MQVKEFDLLKTIYEKNGFHLYLVGGTVRDLLLDIPVDDLDFVTDATPEEEKSFLPEANYTFAKFGSIRLTINGKEIDITTLREEGEYQDHRHPSYIRFVTDLGKDYLRRDFTINALYLDKDYQVIDFCGGLSDLQNKIIRFVGDPALRIQEDPLRICRAERFRDRLGFQIEENSQKAIEENFPLLKKLNPAKIKEEIKKGWKEHD